MITSVDRKCIFCGITFSIALTGIKFGKGKFCSRRCYWDCQKRIHKERPCPFCGKTFSVPSSENKSRYGRYCSWYCANAGNPSAIERTCATCGSIFFIAYPNGKGNDRRIYCSRECRAYGKTTPIIDRLIERLHIIPGPNGCWLLQNSTETSKTSSSQYRKFWYRNKQVKAHQFSYQYFRGEIPEGLLIRHSCDVRSCVNPAHLLPGTNKDNYLDMVSRGRLWRGKIKEEEMLEILTRNDIPSKEFAKKHHVELRTINNIRKGKVHIETFRKFKEAQLHSTEVSND